MIGLFATIWIKSIEKEKGRWKDSNISEIRAAFLKKIIRKIAFYFFDFQNRTCTHVFRYRRKWHWTRYKLYYSFNILYNVWIIIRETCISNSIDNLERQFTPRSLSGYSKPALITPFTLQLFASARNCLVDDVRTIRTLNSYWAWGSSHDKSN